MLVNPKGRKSYKIGKIKGILKTLKKAISSRERKGPMIQHTLSNNEQVKETIMLRESRKITKKKMD